jgi:predicted TIM-barrel enzyme
MGGQHTMSVSGHHVLSVTPEDAAYVLKNTKGIAGFFGASSIERLPTEKAITGQVEAFKAI